MGVKYYCHGEHPSGFTGFRVTVAYGGEYFQGYFSTTGARDQNDSDRVFKLAHLKAQRQDAEWQAESLLYQYQKYVSENHPTTKPERGVGVHGITAIFFLDRRKRWQAGFSVQRPKELPVRITFRTLRYSSAWERTVDTWAEVHGILDEDKARVLASMPSPNQFTRLRRYMNEYDGFDIPVESLSPVFREQRAELAEKRVLKKHESASPLNASMRNTSRGLKDEMAMWFESATAQEGA